VGYCEKEWGGKLGEEKVGEKPRAGNKEKSCGMLGERMGQGSLKKSMGREAGKR
jgi:hypothetical protein